MDTSKALAVLRGDRLFDELHVEVGQPLAFHDRLVGCPGLVGVDASRRVGGGGSHGLDAFAVPFGSQFPLQDPVAVIDAGRGRLAHRPGVVDGARSASRPRKR